MADLYSVLLKNTKHTTFGANLTNIIAPKRKRGKVVKTQKLMVTYDGEVQKPVDCQSISVKFNGDAIILDIVSAEKEIEQSEFSEDAPQTEAVVPAAVTDKFELQGDDLEALELLSDFRRKENQGEKTDETKLEAFTLESGTFDIQDLTSVQNAMLDIVEKEKQFIDQGYIVFKANVPRFNYENNNNFKLIESAVLINSNN
ncbi:MAG: hypothetical protein U9R15_14190 [Chloroflexota bacterium]|nr:hypothetical protein [Chloroflexota bacterium]